MRKYRRDIAGAFLIAAALALCGCSAKSERPEDIVVLYTGDVHCAVDENTGYAGLAAYKKQMEEKTPYVTLVDCGDAIQGDAIGLVSKGEYPVQIMNRTGYDLAVLGNHEFDYGMERLSALIGTATAQYLGCNIRYSGNGENALSGVKPYQIASYGDTDVAFIGVCTPENITSSTPVFFCDETGQFVYDFYGGGGIRADLPAGEITCGDLIGVHPFGNTLCVAEVRGQDILDALEMANRAVQAEYGDGGNAVGENGGFLQVSGITFTVDTTVASTVETDENEMFVSCGDVRRVKDVMVRKEDGSYEPLDPRQTYTVASQNYLIKRGGDGLNMFMDKPLTVDGGLADYMILETYIKEELGGVIDREYAGPQGRIAIR